MRGRWASAALGAGIARYRAEGRAQQEVDAANQANQLEMEKMKSSYQHEIDQLRAQQPRAAPQPQQAAASEDPMAKLKKLADLKAQGIITENEFQKLKADLLTKL